MTIGNASAGDIKLQSGAGSQLVVGDTGTAITGTLSVSGNAGLNGATNNIGTTQASTNTMGSYTGSTNNIGTGASTTNNIGSSTSTNTVLGTTSITGVTTINTTGSAATTIGASGNTSAVTLVSGTASMQVSDGINDITGETNNITGTTNNISGTTNINTSSGSTTNIATSTAATTNIGRLDGTNVLAGTTSINASVNNATNINTGTSNGVVTVGNASNTTNLNSAVNNIGVNAYATTNNIGTGSAASTNNIGNEVSTTTVTATAGNSVLSMANGAASLRSGSGANASGFSTFSSAQTLSTDKDELAIQLNGVGDELSRQNIAGASYVNRLEGNTLINGNTYINGTLVYTSNTSATTTVTSGQSVLSGATQATTGQVNIANADGSGAVVDANGKITQGIVGQTTGSLVVTNGVGNTHGFVVTETESVMSGGVNSTSLTLNDRGATFSNAATGAPVTVTGVADGRSDFDAVNVRQYSSAIAAVSAIAHIPAPMAGKDVSLGLGVGTFMGKTAVAFGGNFRLSNNGVVKASVSSGVNSGSRTVVGVGAGWSW